MLELTGLIAPETAEAASHFIQAGQKASAVAVSATLDTVGLQSQLLP